MPLGNMLINVLPLCKKYLFGPGSQVFLWPYHQKTWQEKGPTIVGVQECPLFCFLARKVKKAPQLIRFKTTVWKIAFHMMDGVCIPGCLHKSMRFIANLFLEQLLQINLREPICFLRPRVMLMPYVTKSLLIVRKKIMKLEGVFHLW